jgi:hypothetical protein
MATWLAVSFLLLLHTHHSANAEGPPIVMFDGNGMVSPLIMVLPVHRDLWVLGWRRVCLFLEHLAHKEPIVAQSPARTQWPLAKAMERGCIWAASPPRATCKQ